MKREAQEPQALARQRSKDLAKVIISAEKVFLRATKVKKWSGISKT